MRVSIPTIVLVLALALLALLPTSAGELDLHIESLAGINWYDAARPGDEITYKLVITNFGPGAATNLVIKGLHHDHPITHAPMLKVNDSIQVNVSAPTPFAPFYSPRPSGRDAYQAHWHTTVLRTEYTDSANRSRSSNEANITYPCVETYAGMDGILLDIRRGALAVDTYQVGDYVYFHVPSLVFSHVDEDHAQLRMIPVLNGRRLPPVTLDWDQAQRSWRDVRNPPMPVHVIDAADLLAGQLMPGVVVVFPDGSEYTPVDVEWVDTRKADTAMAD